MSRTTTIAGSDKQTTRRGKPTQGKSQRASDRFDWTEFDALTDEQVVAAAKSDPDAQPLTAEDLKRMKRRPRCYSIRIALRMTQDQFAEAFRIPVGTIRDWEQERTEPDQAAKAYLKVIAVNPEYVIAALAHRPGTPKPKAG